MHIINNVNQSLKVLFFKFFAKFSDKKVGRNLHMSFMENADAVVLEIYLCHWHGDTMDILLPYIG